MILEKDGGGGAQVSYPMISGTPPPAEFNSINGKLGGELFVEVAATKNIALRTEVLVVGFTANLGISNSFGVIYFGAFLNLVYRLPPDDSGAYTYFFAGSGSGSATFGLKNESFPICLGMGRAFKKHYNMQAKFISTGYVFWNNKMYGHAEVRTLSTIRILDFSIGYRF